MSGLLSKTGLGGSRVVFHVNGPSAPPVAHAHGTAAINAAAITSVFAPALAKLPTEAQQLAFWQKWLDSTDAQADAVAASPDFVRHVWAGVPDGLRQRVWQRVRGVPPPQFTVDDARLAPTLVSDLETELTCAVACAAAPEPISDAELEMLRTVLKIDAGIFARASPPPGSVQLLQRISPVTKTISSTLQAFQALSHKLAPLSSGAAAATAAAGAQHHTHAPSPTAASAAAAACASASASASSAASSSSSSSSSSAGAASSAASGAASGAAALAPGSLFIAATLNQTALALADALASWDPALSAALARGGVDVHDLATLLREWVLTLFAPAFPPCLVLRAVDIALLDPRGPAGLAAVLYGVFKVTEASVPALGTLPSGGGSSSALVSSPSSAGVAGAAAAGTPHIASGAAAAAAAAAAANAMVASASAGLGLGAGLGSSAAGGDSDAAGGASGDHDQPQGQTALSQIHQLPARLQAATAADAAAVVAAALAVAYDSVRARDREWAALLCGKSWRAALAAAGTGMVTLAPGVGAPQSAAAAASSAAGGAAAAGAAETPAQRERRLIVQIEELQRLVTSFMRSRHIAAEERARALAQAEAEAESRKAMRRLVSLAAEHVPAARDVVETVERLGAQLAEIEREMLLIPTAAAAAAAAAAAVAGGTAAGGGASAAAPAAGAASGAAAGAGAGSGATAGAGAGFGASHQLSEAFAATRALFDRLQMSLGSALVADPSVSGAGVYARYDVKPADPAAAVGTAGAEAGKPGAAGAAGAGAPGVGAGGASDSVAAGGAGAGTDAAAAAAAAAAGTVITAQGPVFRRTPPATGLIKFSELASYLELPCAHMEGYLRKARSEKGPPNSAVAESSASLSRRFFSLMGPFITHFKLHTDRAPSKDIAVDLRGRTIAMIDNHPLGPYAIEICTRRQTTLYLLFADTELERRRWILAITAVARLPRD
jgi:hypothetical protein